MINKMKGNKIFWIFAVTEAITLWIVLTLILGKLNDIISSTQKGMLSTISWFPIFQIIVPILFVISLVGIEYLIYSKIQH